MDKIVASDGLLHLRLTSWTDDPADYIIYCDACPTGMGFWYPASTLCILCALHNAYQRASSSNRILIYTDNLNTVDIFASLRALPAYNVILRTAVDLLYEGNHELRVLHVPGEANTVADALSRQNYACAWELQPDLTISEFEPYVRIKDGHRFILSPPRPALGATKK